MQQCTLSFKFVDFFLVALMYAQCIWPALVSSFFLPLAIVLVSEVRRLSSLGQRLSRVRGFRISFYTKPSCISIWPARRDCF
jgi:hypothetical protein